MGHNVTPASVDDNRTLIDDYMASTVNKTASFNDDRLMDKVSDSSVGGNQERKIHCSVILICRMVILIMMMLSKQSLLCANQNEIKKKKTKLKDSH